MTINRGALRAFLAESLAIEGIHRQPTLEEIDATVRFLDEPLNVDAVIALQAVYTPGKPLRDRPGMDVRVGYYTPPVGGPTMRHRLDKAIGDMPSRAYERHIAFELLHPFMDGNGPTGRAVWVWYMLLNGEDPFALSFLHRWYYQSLAAAG